MREIKFRVWVTEIPKEKSWMHYCPLENFDSINGSKDIMQYTGLHDKNGKEIYEGDIVKYKTFYYGKEKEHIKKIEWLEYDTDDFGQPHCAGYFDISPTMEIIGNIYETPELLK